MKKRKSNKEFDDRYWAELQHKLTCNLIVNTINSNLSLHDLYNYSKEYARMADVIAHNVIHQLKSKN